MVLIMMLYHATTSPVSLIEMATALNNYNDSVYLFMGILSHFCLLCCFTLKMTLIALLSLINVSIFNVYPRSFYSLITILYAAIHSMLSSLKLLKLHCLNY